MLLSVRPNIYKLLEKEFQNFDVLVDVGCKGFNDLVDFENSDFKILIGISKEFQRGNAFGDYRERKTENLGLTNEKWIEYSKELFKTYTTRFDIKPIDLFEYYFGVNKNSFVICNKVLHFYEDKIKLELIKKFYDSLQKDGLIYLKINHCSNLNNIDPIKMTRIGECVFQNNEVPDDIRYLVKPIQFINILKNDYCLLKNFIVTDDKALTTVIKK